MPKTTKKRPQRRRPAPGAIPPEALFQDALRAGVESRTPGALLSLAALMLGIIAGAEDPAEGSAELVRGLTGAGRLEPSAAALAIATLTGDAELRRRVRRDIADRGQVLPRWLAELDRTVAVPRAVEISTVYRDVDRLLVSATVPGGHPLTAVVLVDNELGALAARGFVLEAPLEDVVPRLLDDAGPDARARDIATADARARIEAAIHQLDAGLGTAGYESWTEVRALVEWLVSLLPGGGRADGLSHLSGDDLDDIAERFLASPFGPTWDHHDLRSLVDEVVAAGSGNGIGDPLVWSPVNVRRLLGPHLRALDSSVPHLDRAPDLIRDLIRYGHAERGIRRALTEKALAAVDAAAPAFLDGVAEQVDEWELEDLAPVAR